MGRASFFSFYSVPAISLTCIRSTLEEVLHFGVQASDLPRTRRHVVPVAAAYSSQAFNLNLVRVPSVPLISSFLIHINISTTRYQGARYFMYFCFNFSPTGTTVPMEFYGVEKMLPKGSDQRTPQRPTTIFGDILYPGVLYTDSPINHQ